MNDPTPTPPDRFHLLTEQRNSRSMNLHALSLAQCVRLINEEDREVPAALRRAEPALTAFIQAAEAGFLAGGRLIYVGAGTSGRLGVLDASEAPPTFMVPPDRVIGIIAGGDTALRHSSEGKEDDRAGAHAELDALALTPNDSLLGIAAGGTTPYVLGALDRAKSPRPPTLPRPPSPTRSLDPSIPRSLPLTALLTCAPMARPASADHLIVLDTGPEVLTGSTRMKAGTATKLALNTISTTLMVRSGRVYENLMVDLRATNDKLRDRAARIIGTLTGLARPDSFALLEHAGGSVKTALVMHRLNIARTPAESILARHAGRLDGALADRSR